MEKINKIWQILLTACIFSLGIKHLSPKEYDNKFLVGLGIIIVCSCLPCIIIGNEVIVLIFPCAIIYLCLDKDSRWYSILSFFGIYVMSCLFDQIFTTICVRILHIPLNMLNDGRYLFVTIFSMIQTILLIIVFYFLGKILRKHIYPKIKSYSKKVLILIGVYITSMMIIFSFNIIVEEDIGYSEATLGFNLIFFSIYFITSIFILISIVKANAEAVKTKFQLQQYENLKEYTNNIEEMHMELRTFKHDYVNIMASMAGYLEEKDYDGLERYFNDHILQLNNKFRNGKSNLSQLMNIKQPELKGLLSAKLIYASEMGIDISIDIYEPIERLNVDSIDIARILGIYMDNAMEAALETEKPKMGVSFISEQNMIIILITNSFINHNISISKMFQKDYSSKGETRGIGLYNVAQILKEYPNIYRDTFIEDGTFFQKLIIE